MSTVGEIIEAVRNLGSQEKGEFLERLSEIEFEDNWDKQIENDARQGRLDQLWEKALSDIKSGRTKTMDEFFNDK